MFYCIVLKQVHYIELNLSFDKKDHGMCVLSFTNASILLRGAKHSATPVQESAITYIGWTTVGTKISVTVTARH